MATKIYGASDDLIEFESGQKRGVNGEVGCYGTDNKEGGVLIICSDGTLLEVKYGKADQGIWQVNLLNKGTLLEKIDVCTEENAQPSSRYPDENVQNSDVAYFKDGLKWAYAATEWERVK